jgi:anti-repressor protein
MENSSKEISLFNYGANQIRVVAAEDGEPWFVAHDVCVVLDLGHPSTACRRLDVDEKQVVRLRQENFLTQDKLAQKHIWNKEVK